MDLVVNKRKYEQIEEMPLRKLEHLHEESVHEVRRHEQRMQHHDKERIKYASLPILQQLIRTRDALRELIDNQYFAW